LECPNYLQDTQGFDWYARQKEGKEIWKDSDAIADVMHRVYHCGWWEWNQGSTLFFWHWHPEFKTYAQDSIPIFMEDQHLSY
jgi:hypothetical protein